VKRIVAQVVVRFTHPTKTEERDGSRSRELLVGLRKPINRDSGLSSQQSELPRPQPHQNSRFA
jgi:hypothetical protein